MENFQQSSKRQEQGEVNFVNKKNKATNNKWKVQNWRTGKNGDGAREITCCGNNNHVFSNCYFKDRICDTYGKKGHLKKICYFNKNKNYEVQPKASQISKFKNKNYSNSNIGTRDKQFPINNVNKSNNFLESDNLDIDTLFQIEQVGTKNDNIIIKVQIENEIIDMQLDTGSAISAISISYYENKFKYLTIVKTNTYQT